MSQDTQPETPVETAPEDVSKLTRRVTEGDAIFYKSVLKPDDLDYLTTGGIYRITMQNHTPILGTVPPKHIATKWIRKKLQDMVEKGKITGLDAKAADKRIDEELKLSPSERTLEEAQKDVQEDAPITAFFELDGGPVMMDYQFKGFFKAAADSLNKEGTHKQVKASVNTCLYVYPPCDEQALVEQGEMTIGVRGRVLPILKSDGTRYTMDDVFNRDDPVLERALRAQTAQGPRVALARSLQIPEGCLIRFIVGIVGGSIIKEDVLRKLCARAHTEGLGQWRNGGYGKMETVELECLKQGTKFKRAAAAK